MGSKSGRKMEMRGSGSSSASEAAVTGIGATFSSDSLNGLKFGKKIYFEDVGSSGGGVLGAGGGSSSSSSSSSSSNRRAMAMALTSAAPAPQPAEKKGKGVAQQQQPPRCQVEGCQVDLTGAKAYYCRHKVCGMHSKSPKVVVAGMEQRFCQQCSRFHLLHEFDQGKRSCRRRLAGHNERRRKPPPGPLSPRFGRFSSFHEDGTGTRFRSFLMDFSYPRAQVSARDLWPSIRPNDRAANSGQCQGSVNPHYAVMQPHQYPPPFAHYPSELPPGECYGGGSTDSSCALSLLSTQPWGPPTVASRNRALNLSSTTSNFNGVPIGHQLVTNVSNSHEIHPDMGIGHFGNSHCCPDENNGQFSGELELALQGNRHYCPEHGSVRTYDHSGNGMNWSL